MLAKAGMVFAISLAVPLTADAQSYRCVGKDGKKYYGSTIPLQCVGVTVEQMNPAGSVTRRIEPRPSSDARASSEAEALNKRNEEAVARDSSRRNRALLATYRSEKDINDARSRALADNHATLQDAERRVAEIRTRIASHEQEVRVAKGNPPAKLAEDLDIARIDLRAQEDLLAVKKKEIGAINARYDEETSRYRELASMDPAARGKALGMDKGVTVTTQPPSSQELRSQQYDARRDAARDRAELQRIERERESARRRAEQERLRADYERRRAAQEQQNVREQRR